MKIERGVMVMKNDRAWGVTCADGNFTEYGWVAPEDAEIHDQRYCKKPTDVSYEESSDIEELETGSLVEVERRTGVISLRNINYTQHDALP